MGRLFEIRIPFFLPLWRRVATTGVCVFWAVVEIASGNPFWSMIFGALALWTAYEFFVIFDPENYRPRDKD